MSHENNRDNYHNYFCFYNKTRIHSRSAVGGVRTNAVLCETSSALLCVLEQPRVDNSSTVPLMRGIELG